jgi:hypothetical protein
MKKNYGIFKKVDVQPLENAGQPGKRLIQINHPIFHKKMEAKEFIEDSENKLPPGHYYILKLWDYYKTFNPHE